MQYAKSRFHDEPMGWAIPPRCLARVFLPCWFHARLNVGARTVLGKKKWWLSLQGRKLQEKNPSLMQAGVQPAYRSEENITEDAKSYDAALCRTEAKQKQHQDELERAGSTVWGPQLKLDRQLQNWLPAITASGIILSAGCGLVLVTCFLQI